MDPKEKIRAFWQNMAEDWEGTFILLALFGVAGFVVIKCGWF